MMLEPTFRHAWKRLTQDDGVNEDVVGRRLVNRLRLLLATEIGDAALIDRGKSVLSKMLSRPEPSGPMKIVNGL